MWVIRIAVNACGCICSHCCHLSLVVSTAPKCNLGPHDLPHGLSKEQTLHDWNDISVDRLFPYVEFVVGDETWQTPRLDTIDDSSGMLICTTTSSSVALVLGYGITVHRARGLTLQAVTFQLDGLFAPGQLYMFTQLCTLSRVHDYKYLKLSGEARLGM